LEEVLVRVTLTTTSSLAPSAFFSGVTVTLTPFEPAWAPKAMPSAAIPIADFKMLFQLMGLSPYKFVVAASQPALLTSFRHKNDCNPAKTHVNTDEELCVSTNNGLSQGKLIFNKGAVFPEINFINYTVSEGLPVNEFNTGAFYKGKSGNLYFGSINGVVWFRPEDIKSNSTLPNIQLTGFMVNEEEADSAVAAEYIQSLSLSYYKNNLFFQFRGIDFNNANKVRYKYQLENWDKDWIYSNTLNEVRYNNLPDGNYVFKVMAEGSLGV